MAWKEEANRDGRFALDENLQVFKEPLAEFRFVFFIHVVVIIIGYRVVVQFLLLGRRTARRYFKHPPPPFLRVRTKKLFLRRFL